MKFAILRFLVNDNNAAIVLWKKTSVQFFTDFKSDLLEKLLNQRIKGIETLKTAKNLLNKIIVLSELMIKNNFTSGAIFTSVVNVLLINSATQFTPKMVLMKIIHFFPKKSGNFRFNIIVLLLKGRL